MKTIKAGNKEYQLRLTTKAAINIEDRIGKNPLNVFMQATETSMPKMKEMLIILHECLNTCNHNIKLDDVYDIYDKYIEDGGNLMSLIELLVGVFEDAGFIPKEEESKN